MWGFRKDDPDIILKDNFEFSAKLVYKGFTRGRSALNIIWRDEKGRKYYSSMTMLDEALKNTPDDQSVYLGVDVYRGEDAPRGLCVSGKFTFKKQGTVILLTRVK